MVLFMDWRTIGREAHSQKKSTVVLVSGLGDDPQKDMDKCAGFKCPMVVPGTNHHVVVLCQPSSRKLHSGQQLVDANKRSAMPMGYMLG